MIENGENQKEVITEQSQSGKDYHGDKKKDKREARKKRLAKVKAFFSKLLGAFDDALYPLDCTCDVCGEELVEDTSTDCVRSV